MDPTSQRLLHESGQTAAPLPTPAIAVAHNNGSRIAVYEWSPGFGAKYSDPATVPTGNGVGAAFAPDGSALVVSHTTSPCVTAYPWSSSGFGTKYANPAILPPGTVCYSPRFSPDGRAVVFGTGSTPYIAAYAWSSSTGFGAKYADPAILPVDAIKSLAFSPDGTAVSLADAYGTPSVSVYSWTGAGFGAKYPDPAIQVAQVYSTTFTSDGAALLLTSYDAPNIHAYGWSAAGFGTKYSDPASAPGQWPVCIACNSASTQIAVGMTVVPYVAAYNWSSATGFGTRIANPSTGNRPAGTVRGIAFNSDDTALACGHDTSPYITAYNWSSIGFGSKYASPTTTIAGNGSGVAFSPT